MARRIRDEIVDDDEVVVERAPRTRRVVTERRTGAPFGPGMNPAGLLIAAVLVVLIFVLFFGYLL